MTPPNDPLNQFQETLLRKRNEVMEASNRKLGEMEARLATARAAEQQTTVQQKADAQSWVGQLGLNPDGLAGQAVNLVAGAISGGSRQVVGATLALPHSIAAGMADASLGQLDTDAYNRYVAGTATPEDMIRLKSHRNLDGQVGGFAAAKASMSANPGLTVLELAQQANASRKVARKINDAFTIDSIEHQGDKNELDAALSGAFQGNVGEIKDGWKGGQYGDVAKGIAGLLMDTGEAAMKHPMGAAQYVAENAPQLLVGAVGVGGKVAMTAANVGYAADYYQQGIEKFQKDNGGKLPDVADRQEIAAWAASLALAEEAGDRIGLAAMKLKGAAKAVTGVGEGAANMGQRVSTEAAKASLLGSLKHTALATGEGALGETLTEGYQTFAEGKASGKEASAEDIFKGAVIGGLSGAALSGGVHAVSELTGSTPEQAAARAERAAEEAKQAAAFQEAVVTGDVSGLVDSQGRGKDPVRALGALFLHSQQATTDKAGQLENLNKGTAIVDALTDQRKEVLDSAKGKDAATVKAAKAQVKSIDAQIETAQKLWDEMVDHFHKPATATAVQEQVDAANTPALDAADSSEVAKTAHTAAEGVISLSMQHPDHVTPEMALNLANNQDNTLTNEQRDYLRQFSEARQAENALRDMGKVSNEILQGSAANVGIAQYRSMIGASVSAGNQSMAQKKLDQLGAFAADHSEKATVARQAITQGLGTQIVKTDAGWKIQPKGTMSDAELRTNGGLALNSARLVQNIATEAKALEQSHAQLSWVVGLRFGTNPATTSAAAPVQSVAPVEQTPATPATATPLPSDAATQTQEKEGPKENILPLEDGKEKTRLELKTPETVAGTPQIPTRVENKSGAIPRIVVGTNPTGFSNINAQASRDHADALGLTQAIEDAFAQGKTATQVKTELESRLTPIPLEERAGFIVGVRATLGIPSQVAEDGKKEFQVWKAEYDKRNSTSSPATSTNTQPSSTSAGAAVSSATTSSTVAEQSPKAELKQAAAEQQAVAPAKAAVAEAAPALKEEEQNKTSTESDPLGLSAKRTPKGEQRTYQKRNLIADFFNQRAGDENGTQRPLAKVTDFLSQVINDTASIFDYTKLADYESMSDQQKSAMENFVEAASAWSKTITDNLATKFDPDYNYVDLMRFFMHEGDVAENVKTAISYAAFSWVAENASRSMFNTPEEINAILNRDEDVQPTAEEWAKLGRIGVRENVVVNSLGQRVVASLGLKANANAPQNLQPQLEAALGAHAMKLLVDKGIITRNTLTGAEMAELTKSASTSQKAKFRFLALTRNEEGILHPNANRIANATRKSGGIVDKLFGVESGTKEPSAEPIPFNQKTTRNTDQAIPSKLAEMVERENAAEHRLNTDLWNVVRDMPEEMVLAMAGVESTEGKHVFNQPGLQAKNDGLKREYERMMDFFSTMPANQKMFFEHSVWKQQRVGIATNVINPQSSKIHRHMVYRPSWESTIALDDKAAIDNFMLRVGEGLGVKTDKQGNTVSLAQVKTKLADPKIQAAVDALCQSMTKGSISTAQQAAIKDGVATGGENFHTLAVLTGLARYENAKADPKASSFTTQIMGEVDGVTNGPMLSHLLMGAGATVGSLFELLNKGGFFQVGSNSNQYNLWRGVAGHLDLYETTTSHMLKNLAGMQVSSRKMAALRAFTGDLGNETKVEKAGRDIIKTPLTAMVFGSSVSSAVDSMADKFVEAVYAKIEALAAMTDMTEQETARVALLASLKELGVRTDANATVQQLMENQLDKQSINALKSSFKATIGKAVEATMKTDFSAFLEQRTAFNQTAQLSFEIYNAAAMAIKESFIQELADKGELATRQTKNGKTEILHELNSKQAAELKQKLAGLAPIMQTALSQESHQHDAGLFASKSGRKLSDRAGYTNEVKFGQPFKDNDSDSVTVHAYERVESAPGVAMVPMAMHSTDSAISHHARDEVSALNIHDALGAGVNGLTAVATALNHATWNAMLGYSPASAIADMLLQTVRGTAALIKDGKLPAGVAENIVQALKVLAEKQKLPADTLLDYMATQARSAAYTADNMKLQALEQMGYIDQYALEGGHYEVTPEDHQAAAKARSKLSDAITAEDRAALEALHTALKDAFAKEAPSQPAKAETKEATKTTAAPAVKPVAPQPVRPHAPKSLPEQGKSGVQSDPKLVEALRKNPVMTVKQAVAMLRSVVTDDFRQKLLSQLERTIDGNLKVRLVTPDTNPATLMAGPSSPKANGWYSFYPKTGEAEIYLLSPEFAYSGISEELMLHEMTHAALMQIVRSKNKSKEVQQLVSELEVLLKKARAYIASTPNLKGKNWAVQNLDEMIAYGMTNAGFRDNVLKQISMESTTGSNRLVTAMQKFIDIVTQLVFGRANARASTGMDVLMQNVSGLFQAVAEQGEKDAPWSSDMVTLDMATGLNDLSTEEMYDALAQVGTSQVAPAFDAHLRTLLGSIVEKIHGPFGSFAAQVTSTLTTPLDVWANAKVTGQAPFAAKSLVSGLAFTEQEAFVTEQVEATIRTVMADKDGSTTAAYRELVRLYDDVKAKLKPSDFPNQAAYDFVFGIVSNADGKSEYLSRFAALGLGNAQMNQLLQFTTPIKSGSLAGLSMSEKLHAIFERILTWLNGKLTATFEGQEANEKLTTLVSQLVDIEAKKRMKLAQSPAVMAEFVENAFRSGANNLRAGAVKVGESAFFKKSKNGFVKLTGRIVTTVAGDRVDQLMDAVTAFRDTHFKESQGIMAGLVNEARGATPANAMFHKLLRVSKTIEGTRKDLITNTTAFVMESFKDGGEYLTKEMKAAVSAVLLRTDVASLLGSHSMANIQRLVEDKSHLASTITATERQLNQFGSDTLAYINSARLLAYYKATGHLAGAHVLMNAENIAALHGTARAGKVSQADQRTAAPIIDKLVTLYALSYVDDTQRQQAAEVLREEAGRGQANGVEMILKLHAQLQNESRDRLFSAAGTLRMKGYLPEMYNPYVKILVANASTEGPDLIAQGYVESVSLTADQADPDRNTDQRIYVLRDGGLTQHLTGIMSYTGQRMMGSPTHNGDKGLLSQTGLANLAKMNEIQRDKANEIQRMFTHPIDPTQVRGKNYMAPVLDSQGNVVNYRYMMADSTKDVLLERDNRFENLLGAMAGNIYDKQMTAEQNRKAVQALHDQYREEFATKARSYVRVGANSSDPEMREIWRLLPDTTQQAIREIWGSNNMMVRIDLLDINFGYRKLSIMDPFGIPEAERGKFQKLYVEFFEGMLGKKAALYLRRGEDIWQALVREAKDTMVVKSGVTLLGNFTSNVSELIWFGVPMTDIVKHHRVAMKGVMAYRKDSAELARLQIELDTGHMPGKNPADVRNRVAQLKDSMARNPVRELIDAGLMPTIVEDTASEEDPYSFKGRLTRKVDEVVDSMNPHIVATGKLLIMAHDTPLYQVLSYGTQVSDFIARYTLYQHVISRAANPMDAQTAVQLVSDAFVNYDVPSHRGVQFANDMGLVYFSKYYLRIQKVIALLYRQNPGRALMLLTLGHFLDFIPLLTHSSAMMRFGNPFSTGAFEAIGSLDEMATVNALMTPFR